MRVSSEGEYVLDNRVHALQGTLHGRQVAGIVLPFRQLQAPCRHVRRVAEVVRHEPSEAIEPGVLALKRPLPLDPLGDVSPDACDPLGHSTNEDRSKARLPDAGLPIRDDLPMSDRCPRLHTTAEAGGQLHPRVVPRDFARRFPMHLFSREAGLRLVRSAEPFELKLGIRPHPHHIREKNSARHVVERYLVLTGDLAEHAFLDFALGDVSDDPHNAAPIGQSQ